MPSAVAKRSRRIAFAEDGDDDSVSGDEVASSPRGDSVSRTEVFILPIHL
jgi:hypothetical protein